MQMSYERLKIIVICLYSETRSHVTKL